MSRKRRNKSRKRNRNPIDADEFLRQNADPIWMHQHEMWEVLHERESSPDSVAVCRDAEEELFAWLNELLAEAAEDEVSAEDWLALNEMLIAAEIRAEEITRRFLKMKPLQRQIVLARYAHEITRVARYVLCEGDPEMALDCNETIHHITAHMARYRKGVSLADARRFIERLVRAAKLSRWEPVLSRAFGF